MKQRAIFAIFAIVAIAVVTYLMFHDATSTVQEFDLPDVYIQGARP